MEHGKQMRHFARIVVGGGIEGSATAYALAHRGQNTLLLEQVRSISHFL